MTDLTSFFKEDIFNEYIEDNITENKDKICMICFSEYNNGPEAHIWNNYFSNLIQGFDELNQKKKSPKYNI